LGIKKQKTHTNQTKVIATPPRPPLVQGSRASTLLLLGLPPSDHRISAQAVQVTAAVISFVARQDLVEALECSQ